MSEVYLPLILVTGMLHGVGATYGQCEYMPLVGAKWYYNWNLHPPVCSGVESVGMIWDASSAGLPSTGTSNYILWFNEPSNKDQANLTPEAAAQLWNANVNSTVYDGKKHVSPADYDLTWLSRFLSLVTRKPDVLAIHLYAWRDLASEIQIAQTVFGRAVELAQVHGIKEIWLTEWAGLLAWMGMGPALEYMRVMLKEILPSFPMITREAPFQLSYLGTEPWAWGSGCNTSLVTYGTGEITPFGQVYRDNIDGQDINPNWDGRADINQDDIVDILDLSFIAGKFGQKKYV